MELQKCIEKRRSIRKYKDKKVDKKDIEIILNSARLCQSAKNRQPWKFKVINNKNDLEFISSIMKTNSVNEDKPNSINNTAKIIESCPLVILVFRDSLSKDFFISDLVSIGAAIEHICLTCVDLGLSSLWVRDTYIVDNQILEYFNLKDIQLVSCVCIGYQDEYPSMRPRKDLPEILI